MAADPFVTRHSTHPNRAPAERAPRTHPTANGAPDRSPPWPTADLLQPYTPPTWFTKHLPPAALARLPRHRLALLPLPTPVHALVLPPTAAAALPPGTRLYVKRDDVAVGTVGGSKARKLAFSLAAAVATDGTTAVLTAGNAGSNHAAATAAAAARVGLTPHVLLLTPEPSDGAAAVAAGGGLMGIHAAARSRLHLVPEAVHAHIGAALAAGARRLEAGGGGGGGGGGDRTPAPRVAVIGMGGSDAVGLLGYLDAWDELLRQGVGAAGITDVVVATGSGGTAAGLAIAAACTGGRVRVHAVVVRNDAAHCRAHVAAMAAAWGLCVAAGGEAGGGGRRALAVD